MNEEITIIPLYPGFLGFVGPMFIARTWAVRPEYWSGLPEVADSRPRIKWAYIKFRQVWTWAGGPGISHLQIVAFFSIQFLMLC